MEARRTRVRPGRVHWGGVGGWLDAGGQGPLPSDSAGERRTLVRPTVLLFVARLGEVTIAFLIIFAPRITLG